MPVSVEGGHSGMVYYVRDPNNPHIMIETNVDPTPLASPRDLQTSGDRMRNMFRRKDYQESAERGDLPDTLPSPIDVQTQDDKELWENPFGKYASWLRGQEEERRQLEAIEEGQKRAMGGGYRGRSY